jgi:hypothetical protein
MPERAALPQYPKRRTGVPDHRATAVGPCQHGGGGAVANKKEKTTRATAANRPTSAHGYARPPGAPKMPDPGF